MCMSSGGGQGGGFPFAGIFAARRAARNAGPGAAGTPGVIGPSPSYPVPAAPGG